VPLLDILYTNYYRFYKKIIGDPEPHFATILALSFSESLLINGIAEIAAIKWWCYEINLWIQFAVAGVLICLNYIGYVGTSKYKKLVNAEPAIANSNALSIIVTWLFFLVTTSWLFWGAIYTKHVLNQCR
jgi:hypothetical protein